MTRSAVARLLTPHSVAIVGAAPAPVASESEPDAEMPQEHPDDVARYAFDRLL